MNVEGQGLMKLRHKMHHNWWMNTVSSDLVIIL